MTCWVSCCFWAADTELALEEETEELESDWVEEDWARARATCSEIWGVSTERIWEVIWASELLELELEEKLLEDWLLELWPMEEVVKDLAGSGAGAGAGATTAVTEVWVLERAACTAAEIEPSSWLTTELMTACSLETWGVTAWTSATGLDTKCKCRGQFPCLQTLLT